MVMDQTVTERHPAHSAVRLSRNNLITTGVKCTVIATSAGAVNGAIDLVAPALKPLLSDAINAQRLNLLNVLGMLHCIGTGVTSDTQDTAPEFAGAFELLECEIRRIATTLRKISLRSEVRETSRIARLEARRKQQKHT